MRPKGMDLTVIPPLFPRHIFDCVKLAISSSPEAHKILKKNITKPLPPLYVAVTLSYPTCDGSG